MRGLPDNVDDTTENQVEWSAVGEGFRVLERDLGKLQVHAFCCCPFQITDATSYQQFIEMNATGFRKILKKWDKHSSSTTKELYLARQVDIQPVFNRQVRLISLGIAVC
jgi:CDK inhibitor PHO81